MRLLFLLIISLTFTSYSFSQCENSVRIIDTRISDSNPIEGTIVVEVHTSGEFIATLNIEKGTGTEKIHEQRGRNSSTIQFDKLALDQIYQVQVEFSAEDKSLCRKLQRSGIVIDEN